MSDKTKTCLSRLPGALLVSMSLLVFGCSDNDNDGDPLPVVADETPAAEFEVELVNLTAGQPFSPPLVLAHSSDYALFNAGAPASEGLEQLAESGDSMALIATAQSNAAVLASVTGDGVVPPGGSASLNFTVNSANLATLGFSVVTMLVNTNDAIMAVNGRSLADLAVGDSLRLSAIAYDSGTEANSEAAGTIPGPADGGQGFDPVRDDRVDRVLMHSGVLSADGGLADSVLTETQRWDNPVARVIVTRTR